MTKEQWQAIKSRDKQYDGAFFCGLISSRTVCKPSCAYRARQPHNVILFSTLEEALAQGYKPCSHCRPDRPHWEGAKKELVNSARQYIEEHSAEKFSLKTLSGALFVNGSYLLRTFKEATGTTLLWYHNHVRCERAKQLLTQNDLSVSDVGERTGFSSSSHFSRVFKKMVGMSPSEYRSDFYRRLEG